MSDIKLFQYGDKVKQLKSSEVSLERELQTIIEKNMETFFGVKFLASEYVTTNGGRMDSIGIDENFCPVIFEYKRSQNENVINQGLFYLDWLLHNKDSFELLVLKKLDQKTASKIDWSMPRVICIASDFSKYDEFAINQMIRNISLIRYKKFDSNLLMFEQVNQNVVKPIEETEQTNKPKHNYETSTFSYRMSHADKKIQQLYETLREFILGLGDDVTENELKLYSAFKKMRNITTVVPQKTSLTLNLPLDVSTVTYEEGFSRDVTNIGHWGCGEVEVFIKDEKDLEKAKPLIIRAYEEN